MNFLILVPSTKRVCIMQKESQSKHWDLLHYRAIVRHEARWEAGGARGTCPPHFWTDQLTLSQPGGHIIPTQYYVPPQIFRPCDGPENGSLLNVLFSFLFSILNPQIQGVIRDLGSQSTHNIYGAAQLKQFKFKFSRSHFLLLHFTSAKLAQ